MSFAGPPAPPAPPPPPPIDAHRPGRGRRRAVLALSGVALTAAVVGGSLAYVRMSPGPAPARPANVVASGVANSPELLWSSDVETRAAQFATISTPGSTTTHDSVVDAGSVLVLALAYDSDTSVSGIDSATGEVRWTAQTGGGTCSAAVVDRILACSDGRDRSTVSLLDVDTGEVRGEETYDHQVVSLTNTSDTLYTSGIDSAGALIASARARSGEGSSWQAVQRGECEAVTTTTSQTVAVGDLVAFSAPSRPTVVLDGTSGTVLVPAALQASPLGTDLLDIGMCGQESVTVVNGRGDQVHRRDARSFAPPIDFTTRQVPLVTGAGDAYDRASGDVLWSTDTDVEAVDAAVGDVLVIRGAAGLSALDMATGSVRWTYPSTTAVVDATDGAVLVVTEGSETIGVAAVDGSVLWSETTGTTTSTRAESTAVDAGLLTVSPNRIELRRPSGAPTVPSDTVGSPTTGEDVMASDGASGPDGDQYVTKCGSAPVFTPTNIVTGATGLEVTMAITATCPDGDVLSSSDTRVALSVDGQNVAAATFDLSATPLAVPASGSSGTPLSARRTFTFPLGSFWRTARDLPAVGSGGTSLPSSSSGSTYLVECEQNGTSGPDRLLLPDGTIDLQPLTATAVAAPVTGDAESAAFDALRAIADADSPTILSTLAERWVPQLSSKKPGLVADGRVWDNAATLEEHLALRLRYPDTRLVWTGEWSTFSYPDFWVTMVGVTYPDADSALGWCRSNGFDREHCYAKLISTTHPIDGSTKTQ